MNPEISLNPCHGLDTNTRRPPDPDPEAHTDDDDEREPAK